VVAIHIGLSTAVPRSGSDQRRERISIVWPAADVVRV
jgi:hypothetical protein